MARSDKQKRSPKAGSGVIMQPLVHLIEEDTCPQAWLKAVEFLSSNHGAAYNLVLAVRRPEVLKPADFGTHDVVDGFLRQQGRPPLTTIAGTIFPANLYLHGGAEELYTYPQIYPRIPSQWGTYAIRLLRKSMVARKTSRLVEELKAADWKRSPRTDADGQCEFRYQPEGWGQAYRFIALRYEKKPNAGEAEREQYQLFDTPEYTYRVFVTDMDRAIDLLVWFYNQRAGAENLIKEANNDAGLAAHPSGRWATNCVHFQIAMLAYNLNCWLMLFHREEQAKVAELKHTTLAIARLRFLFLAAKIWRHAGRVGVSYSDHYTERGLFQRLMERLRSIAPGETTFHPVLATALRS